MEIISCSHVNFAYPGCEEDVLKDVSFSIRRSEFVVLCGKSGCGKSMMALSIMGLVPIPPGRIAGGEILYRGTDLLTLEKDAILDIRGKRIAMIFQEPMTALNPVLRIRSQMYEAFEGEKLSKEEKRRRVTYAMT